MDIKPRKIGNSVGVVLPKETVVHLGATEGDSPELTSRAKGQMNITGHQATASEQILTAQSIMQRYRNTLRELAK